MLTAYRKLKARFDILKITGSDPTDTNAAAVNTHNKANDTAEITRSATAEPSENKASDTAEITQSATATATITTEKADQPTDPATDPATDSATNHTAVISEISPPPEQKGPEPNASADESDHASDSSEENPIYDELSKKLDISKDVVVCVYLYFIFLNLSKSQITNIKSHKTKQITGGGSAGSHGRAFEYPESGHRNALHKTRSNGTYAFHGVKDTPHKSG